MDNIERRSVVYDPRYRSNDSINRGDQSKGGHREEPEKGKERPPFVSPRQHDHNNEQHRCYSDCFDEEPWQLIHGQRVLRGLREGSNTFVVTVQKVVLAPEHLCFLDPAERLIDPLDHLTGLLLLVSSKPLEASADNRVKGGARAT